MDDDSNRREGGGEEERKQREKIEKLKQIRDEIQNQRNELLKKEAGDSNLKGKSCKGYLYYSSTLKSNGCNPRCIGVPRSLNQMPNYVNRSEVEASKDGRALTDFYYACAGYSVYINKDRSTDEQMENRELPVCLGLELLVDKRAASSDTASAPAHVHHKEDGRELPQLQHQPRSALPQPRSQKPAHSAGDDFLSRFTRNASLVASGVARNMLRVGNYLKESVDDILFPYRRRPK